MLRGKLKDETGNKYGKLTVLRRGESKNRNATWLCSCECGKEVLAWGGNLRAGHTISCGCLHRLPPGLSSARSVMSNYRGSARRRGLAWELTEGQFLDLTSKDCHYCGVEPRQVASFNGANGDYTYNGIDRVDNSRGYTLENCVPCCKRCNKAKGTMGLDEFYEWVARVYRHS